MCVCVSEPSFRPLPSNQPTSGSAAVSQQTLGEVGARLGSTIVPSEEVTLEPVEAPERRGSPENLEPGSDEAEVTDLCGLTGSCRQRDENMKEKMLEDSDLRPDEPEAVEGFCLLFTPPLQRHFLLTVDHVTRF